MAIPLRTPDEIERVAHAGDVLWRVLDQAVALVRPGLTGADLDRFVTATLIRHMADPVLRRVRNERGDVFPGACCVNINDSVAHAPPSDRPLAPGDLVSLDLSIAVDGWHADACRAVVVGRAEPGRPGPDRPDLPDPRSEATDLAAAAHRVLRAGLAACRPGRMWSEVAGEMRGAADDAGVALVPGLGGHGIGRALHEPPLAWIAPPGPDFRLTQGMILTLEPVVTLGRGATRTEADGWSIRTTDGRWGACEERTIAITPGPARVLTGPGLGPAPT